MECSQKHLLGTGSNDGYYDDEDFVGIDPIIVGGTGQVGQYSNNVNYNMHGFMGQPVTPPETEHMSNGYVAMPSLNNQMVYPTSFQDFAAAGPSNGLNQQRQAQLGYNQYDQYQNLGVSTPRPDYHRLDSPELNGVKLDFDENGDLFNLSGLTVSLSSSQESSTEGGFRVPVLTNFPGKYEFLVEPFEKSGKKCLLWKDANKIFCSSEVEILFSLQINDFQAASLKDLTVETMMVYSSNEHVMEPIVRCVSDIEIERKKKNGMDSELYIRVLRSSCPKAKYGIKTNERHFVSEPLEKPHPGENYILRNYSCMCVNSCKLGMNKRGACILFYLMEKGKEVGRQCYNIKICKCPTRDWKQENEKSAHGGKRKKSTSPKVEHPDSDDVAKAAKQRRISPSASPTGFRTGQAPAASNAGESPGDKKCSQDTDEEVLSQDSLGSVNVSHKVAKDVKLVMAHCKNPDVVCNQIAHVAWNQYKSFRKTVKFMRTHILKDGGQRDPEAEEDLQHQQGSEFKSELQSIPGTPP